MSATAGLMQRSANREITELCVTVGDVVAGAIFGLSKNFCTPTVRQPLPRLEPFGSGSFPFPFGRVRNATVVRPGRDPVTSEG